MVGAVDTTCPAELDLRVLGSLQIQVRGRAMPIRAAKVRALAAALMVRAGRAAPVDGLLADLWADDPPRSAVANLRTYATQLRRLLPPGRLVTVDSGYRLLARADELDLSRARALTTGGRAALADHDLARAEHQLDLACRQWRGRPLDGVPAGVGLDAMRVALEEEFRALLQLRVRTGLATGRAGEVLPLARAGAAANPLVEAAQELLMLTLWHNGDSAGALQVYASTRTALVRELGIEPGEGLRRLQRGLLGGDPAPAPLPDCPQFRQDESAARQAVVAATPQAEVTPAAPASVAGRSPCSYQHHSAPRTHRGPHHHEAPPPQDVPRPHELPPPAALLGRDAELAAVVAALAGPRAAPRAPVLVGVHGRPGSGTSALVVAAAHLVRGAFPDGQVHVDLAEAGAVGQAEVVRRVLRSLVPSSPRQPGARSVDEASARLRSALHGRTVLVVLDNAVDAEQVRPLLSSSPGVAVLVASGPMLATLDATEQVGLGPLDDDAALALLERVAGHRIGAHERASALAVVDLCERLPAAIRIVGARLASRADLSLTVLARLLGDETHRLEELCFGSSSVYAGLQQLYRGLVAGGPQGALVGRVYRALGSVAGPLITPNEVCDATGALCVPAARGALDRLVHLRLIEPAGEDLFLVPDLVRLHARRVGVDAAAWPVPRRGDRPSA